MPRFRISRHEDWIAVIEVEADSLKDAEAKERAGEYDHLWEVSDSDFNDIYPRAPDIEEVDERGIPV